MRDGLAEAMGRMIAEIAAGAGDGAHALRRAGIPVELEGYTVEVVVDPDEANPFTSVRLAFCRAVVDGQDGNPDSLIPGSCDHESCGRLPREARR
jgi:hypothetical protein